MLDVPVNKTSTAFTKPVDPIVGEMISAWKKVRPKGMKLADSKTAEMVDFLFLYRLTVVGKSYLNKVLIPTLCRKPGIPTNDVRGNITSHRGRSTIASQLFNAKEPMTLFELQEWLGHGTPAATQHYARITPTKLAKSYADAGYFARNLRAIEVLVDPLTKRWSATDVPRTSLGSFTIRDTGSAPTTSSSKAHTAWLVPSATFICRKNRAPRCYLRANATS
jgi:hypothetical protein